MSATTRKKVTAVAAADGLTLSERVPQKTPNSFGTLAAFKQVPVEKYVLNRARVDSRCPPRLTPLSSHSLFECM
jgi:hypothetical protein